MRSSLRGSALFGLAGAASVLVIGLACSTDPLGLFTAEETIDGDEPMATGPGISGTLNPTATAGARLPIGQVDLLFAGSGDWAGTDVRVTTAVDGSFGQAVPSGWTGTISAADPVNLYLTPEIIQVSDPVTVPVTGQDFAAWRPPIAIPAPPFGVLETVERVFGDPAYFTHYVDNTHPNATNTNNPYGTVQTPRLSIPPSLPAGSVVEVHGGPYYANSDAQWSGSGTTSRPIFIRGANGVSQVVIGQNGTEYDIAVSGSYLIIENFEIRGHRVVTGEPNSADHISIRHNHVHHTGDAGVLILPDGQFNVVFDNEIDHADYLDLSDDHGVSASDGTRNVWILDNHLHHNGGDSIQFCHGCGTNAPRNFYIGRNLMHDDIENGIDIKATLGPVIISQNEIYGHSADPSFDIGSGSAIRINDEGEQGPIAILFNRIHDGPGGIDPDGSSAADHGWLYIIGNVIYDVEESIYGVSPHTVSNTIFSSAAGESSGWGISANNLIVSQAKASQHFVDAAGGNFHLVAGSPAIDTGVNIPSSVTDSWQTNIGVPYGIPFPAVDADGTLRPQGGAWDKGAYERP